MMIKCEVQLEPGVWFARFVVLLPHFRSEREDEEIKVCL